MKEGAKRWLRFASHDLRWAVIHASAGDYDHAVYLLQQTIEKSIKAVIILKGEIPPKTHNVRALYDRVYKLGVEVPKDIEGAVNITPYAFTTRYPDDYVPVSSEEYKEAYEIAVRVYEWAKGIINPERT